jgi:hypothetical protein
LKQYPNIRVIKDTKMGIMHGEPSHAARVFMSF